MLSLGIVCRQTATVGPRTGERQHRRLVLKPSARQPSRAHGRAPLPTHLQELADAYGTVLAAATKLA